MGASVYICRTETAEGTRDYVTLLPPDFTGQHGLIKEAIVGMLTRPLDPEKPDITPESFARNGVFVDFMHEMIGRAGPQHAGLQAAAKQRGNGQVYIVDLRLPENEKVEPEDIVGAFQAKDGQIVPGSYSRNPEHRILSRRGFFRLDAGLHQYLIQELVRRSDRNLKAQTTKEAD